MKYFPLLMSFLFGSMLQAQTQCAGDSYGNVFQANRIGAFISPRGSNFFDFSDGYFKIPYESEDSPITIFASSPWIAGFADGELKLAGTRHVTLRQDYYLGPLSPDNTVYTDACDHFNKVWSVSRGNIEKHIQDYADNNFIDSPVSSIFGWPAEKNASFETYNGFALPSDHVGGWAEFHDANGNNIYEPHQGEYPHILLKGKAYIPESISWTVYNDQGDHEQSGGSPLGVEIQQTVFGFHCDENYVLNNTLFISHEIINQSQKIIDSTFFGLWTDYDLGCSEDDYIGSDSTRNTEFAYNEDDEDGDVNSECTTGKSTYGQHSPVQSMTFLSHDMNSFTVEYRLGPGYDNPEGQYNLMQGLWADGSPMVPVGDGFDESGSGTTKFLFHGDPRDENQWSWYHTDQIFNDPGTISTVFLDELTPGNAQVVETAYTFHQDLSLNHLDQIGFMYANIDSLLTYIEDIEKTCTRFPVCSNEDCVWPGDFDHNGIADHFDLLYWGVMKDSTGSMRDGLINWNGHFADPWSLELPTGLNSKHGDGNGDGITNLDDLDRNLAHFLLTNPYYEPHSLYPEGPEIIITSESNPELTAFRNIQIHAGTAIPNVLGLAYQLDYDTSLYDIRSLRIPLCPLDSNIICITDEIYNPGPENNDRNTRYAFVKTDHATFDIEEGFLFDRVFGGLVLKENVSPDDVPDSVVIRLKNLIAIDAEGNDLHIGSMPLVFYKEDITDIQDLHRDELLIYPNPANNEIYIDAPENSVVEIISLQGEIVDQHVLKADKKISVINYHPGMYVVRIPSLARIAKVVIF